MASTTKATVRKRTATRKAAPPVASGQAVAKLGTRKRVTKSAEPTQASGRTKVSSRASTTEGAKKRAAARRRQPQNAAQARDMIWAEAAKPRPGDRANRTPDDLLSAPARRMQQVADAELAVVNGRREEALRTLGGISIKIAREAKRLQESPTKRMTNKQVAELLEGFLLNPT